MSQLKEILLHEYVKCIVEYILNVVIIVQRIGCSDGLKLTENLTFFLIDYSVMNSVQQ